MLYYMMNFIIPILNAIFAKSDIAGIIWYNVAIVSKILFNSFKWGTLPSRVILSEFYPPKYGIISL